MANPPIYQSTDAILTHGATSGAAMLAGFFARLATPDPCLLIPDSCPVEVSMPILTRIKPSEYHDSITLMLVAKALLELPGVEDAAVVMGTPANREIIAAAGLLTDAAVSARPDDLVIAIRARTRRAGRLRCAKPTTCWRRARRRRRSRRSGQNRWRRRSRPLRTPTWRSFRWRDAMPLPRRAPRWNAVCTSFSSPTTCRWLTRSA